jgi:FlaA1/EpsC-like NDP-sugar epimerase
MERMFCSINKRSQTRFTNVRFGNIAWSSGSALPIWTKMAKANGKIQSTGSHMRRYMTTVEEAAQLVIRSFNNIEALQGGVLIHDMKAVQISDLLDVFCELNNSTWEKIDPRPGEREDEYLLGDPELPFSKEVIFDNLRHFFFTPNFLQDKPVTEILSTLNAPRFSRNELLEIVEHSPE